jgi:hypothetical protein
VASHDVAPELLVDMTDGKASEQLMEKTVSTRETMLEEHKPMPPKLTVQDAQGNEDTAIGLTISARVTDPSETLSIIISGLPESAILSAGKRIEDGAYLLTATQLVGLTITPPPISKARSPCRSPPLRRKVPLGPRSFSKHSLWLSIL